MIRPDFSQCQALTPNPYLSPNSPGMPLMSPKSPKQGQKREEREWEKTFTEFLGHLNSADPQQRQIETKFQATVTESFEAADDKAAELFLQVTNELSKIPRDQAVEIRKGLSSDSFKKNTSNVSKQEPIKMPYVKKRVRFANETKKKEKAARAVLNFPDGIYQGDFSQKELSDEELVLMLRTGGDNLWIPHGRGEMRWTSGPRNGDKYTGQFQNGKMSGKGRYICADGSYFQGKFENDDIGDSGTFFYAETHDKYQGSFLKGDKHGKGTYTWSNGDKYEGDFAFDEIHGFGTFFYANKSRYTGQFVNGVREGQGTYVMPDGDKYSGQFFEGLPHGLGIFICSAADFVGHYDKGKKHGLGAWYERNAFTYIGNYADDEWDGQGILYFPNGDKYEGQFLNGKRHGEGTFTKADGQEEKRSYSMGKRLKPPELLGK